MTEITRHFTSSVYIVHEGKVLLHKHKKLNLILPPGGHIDRDELPHEAAIREAKEETGLEIELLNPQHDIKFSDSTELNRGFHLNLHNINEFHQHVDFVFYAKALTTELKPQPGESKEFTWFSEEEIRESTFLNENTKFYALEAIEKIKE